MQLSSSRLLCCLSLGLALACKRETAEAGSDASVTPTAVASSPAAPVAPVPAKKDGAHSEFTKGNPSALGPELIVVPGKGMSAIRFGTNFETLARHMEAPCDVRTETRCVYVDQAVDFGMKDGVVASMKIYRRDRRVPDVSGTRYFGSFHGAVPPSILPGLHRHVVEQEFGKPKSVTPVDPPGAEGLVERHFYDGLVFEYDRLENGNVVLATIEIVPDKAAGGAPAATPKK